MTVLSLGRGNNEELEISMFRKEEASRLVKPKSIFICICVMFVCMYVCVYPVLNGVMLHLSDTSRDADRKARVV